MNRLANASSPYLRAHADNPVAWFPWGREAFALAAERDVPVMISIGYSTCHWCHVMARESFQDAETAGILNDGFVSIKVDREEHPDVDAAYLDAASAFTPHLGWPLTVFASPEGRVFYAGTYFPPTPRPPQPSFRQVLAAVREAWTERRSEVDATGSSLRDALAAAATAPADAAPTLDQLASAARSVAAREDREYGGFAAGPAFETPKFPEHARAAVPAAPGADPRRSRGRRSGIPGAGGDGRVRPSRLRRGRLLPLRHAPRLERAALRAHAHRQRRAGRGGPRRG